MFILLCCVPLAIQAQPQGGGKIPPEQFLASYAGIAQHEMRSQGILSSIKLGQAILESNWGSSELARNAHNFFGLKCRSANECTKSTYLLKDDDYVNGELVASTFMAFDHPVESFFVHTEFLKRNRRYDFLFDLPKDDYIAWAKGLQKAGYATDPGYADKLISIIEKYELYKYDQAVIHPGTEIFVEVPAKPVMPEPQPLQYPFAQDGMMAQQIPSKPQPNQLQVAQKPTIPTDYATEAPQQPSVSLPEVRIPEPAAEVIVTSEGIYDHSSYIPEAYREIYETEHSKSGNLKKPALEQAPRKQMGVGPLMPR